jgi:hypothetical protein
VTVVVQTSLPLSVRAADDGLVHFEWDFEKTVAAPLPDRDALLRFRKLGTGSGGPDKASRIAKFAQRYGPLCLPTATDLREQPSTERVADWRQWAQTMDAILRICLRDPSPRPQDYEHLKTHFREVSELFPTNPRVKGTERRGYVHSWAATRDAARCVQCWLDIANVRINFSWPEVEAGPIWQVNGMGLLGALALGLVDALRQDVTDEARQRGVKFEVVCTHCGAAYTPQRNPRPGQRRFCRTCRDDKQPEKYRDRAHAARRKKTRRIARSRAETDDA